MHNCCEEKTNIRSPEPIKETIPAIKSNRNTKFPTKIHKPKAIRFLYEKKYFFFFLKSEAKKDWVRANDIR